MTMTESKPATTPTNTNEVASTKTTEQRLRRVDPFELFDDLQQDMVRLWSQTLPFPLMPRPFARSLGRAALAPSAWLPATDVYEKDGMIVVKAEVPGMTKDDIDVSLEKGDLVMKGERRAERDVEENAYYRVERSYGSFYRRIPLGFEVKADQIAAHYHDGVLEVQVPKATPPQPAAEKIALS